MSSTPSPLFGRHRTTRYDDNKNDRKHVLLKVFLGLIVLLAIVIGGVSWYISTPRFANFVRTKLIAVLQDATGGRVELGAFRWRPLHLELEVDNLTIHGLEAPNEVPYAHLDRLFARLKIINLFGGRIGLNYLGVDKPTVHLIVYKDGSTNQPVPKKQSAPSDLHKTIDQIFNIEADRAEVNNGTLLLNQQAIPFALAANDLAVGVNYAYARDQYDATVSIADLTAKRGITAPVHSKLSLRASIGRNQATVQDFQFSAGASTLAAHAAVSNFFDPHWTADAKGTVDLREAEALAAIPGVDRGTIGLDIHGNGTKALFDMAGNVKLANVAYRGSGVYLSGLDASTDLHITQDLLAATNLRARLAAGGTVTGSARIDHWLALTTPSAAPPTVVQPNEKLAATGRAARQVNKTVAQATSNPQAKGQPSQGAIDLRLDGFTLPSVLSMMAPPKFQNLGFYTSASGTVKAGWQGNISDLTADANVALSAPAAPKNGDVPVNGVVDVHYSGRTNSLLVQQLNLHTPGSTLQASGGVGLAAGAHSSLQVQASVSNLGEFDKALVAFGVGANGKKGTAAIPVALHGNASFNGVVTGSLAAPNATGHIAINNFDLILSNPTPPTTTSHPLLEAGAPVGTVPPAGLTGPPSNMASLLKIPTEPGAPGTPRPPTTFHLDSLNADISYSPSKVSVASAIIVRGKTQVHASGELRPHHTRHGYAFDNDAGISATAAIDNANLTDLLGLAGQTTVPVTGTLNVHAQVGGTLGNLSGGGQISLAGGAAYGEPYKSLVANLQFAGQDINVSTLTFSMAGSQLTGNGGYNLTSKQFHFHAQTSGFQIAKLQALKKSPLTIHGTLGFVADASGTPTEPILNAQLHLTQLSVANPAGGPTSTGEIDLVAKTQGHNLIADMDSRLNGATAHLHANSMLTGDFVTQAKLTLSNLDLNPYLGLFNVSGVQGDSIINGTVTVSGPLKTPKLLSGDANLSRIAVKAQGISLGTVGSLHATLRNGRVQLDPLHIAGAGTDVTAQGYADLFGSPRPLNAKVTGTIDTKVAHTFNRDIDASGTITLNLSATNTIEKPILDGAVNFNDVNLAYEEFPNGLSHLNGSLVFDQGRLVVKDLTATSGGGQLTFGGFVTYQAGVYADLSITGKQVRVRYPAGLSTIFDSKLRIQGGLQNILVSGAVQITRFAILGGVDAGTLASNGISPPPDPTAFANRIRLDIHVTSTPQLDINNSYAKVAGNIDLHVRGTAEDPAVLGHIAITEGEATLAGTKYKLQHGDIYFTNPVRIAPTIDLEASAHVEDYDIVVGVHGTPDKLTPVFRSEPPLSEQDIFSLLALGRTQEEQQIYSQQQSQAGVNSTADTVLGGALNATVSSRINKLFGGGSVKIDPTFVSGTGNSTARITVQQQVSSKGTVSYATSVNSTAQQLIQAQYNITPDVAVVAVRDESGVFSLELKLHRRYR